MKIHVGNELVALLVMLYACTCLSEDLSTKDGKLYRDIKVIEVNPDSISISFQNKITTIPFTNLSDELKKKYGYDPVKVEELKKMAEAKKKLQAKENPAIINNQTGTPVNKTSVKPASSLKIENLPNNEVKNTPKSNAGTNSGKVSEPKNRNEPIAADSKNQQQSSDVKEVTARDIQNSGNNNLHRKRVCIVGKFWQLNKARLSFMSPDESIKWVNFYIHDSSGAIFQYSYASEEKYEKMLLDLKEGTDIRLTGKIILNGEWTLVVDDIQIIK